MTRNILVVATLLIAALTTGCSDRTDMAVETYKACNKGNKVVITGWSGSWSSGLEISCEFIKEEESQ